MTIGRVNPAHQAGRSGHHRAGRVHYNLHRAALVEAAVARGEGHLGHGGAFLVLHRQYTGRSPKDKFVVRTAVGRRHDLVGEQRRR